MVKDTHGFALQHLYQCGCASGINALTIKERVCEAKTEFIYHTEQSVPFLFFMADVWFYYKKLGEREKRASDTLNS